ncbi:undecaprenyl-diphosphate phosphatase [Rhodococcus antarcticus]|uniref:Undecaprenyl-diphosphatase n=1 Tax=Rhodococcus antarcticus TaxID=2987751 RepID=A0ABY6P4I1_9NOCA|nr:undecaprenyl-diphosphate phosphatase [Rhodococcus antarcticus]UZJ26574.1 undecaprenyl-diphosphate phosphatase [Rhodococcus antarcticus]
MTWFQALVLGLVQGLTEFLPISSSAHLRIVSGVFFGGDAGASFTAVTQLGTEAAVLVYFWRDIVRIISAWFRGLRDSSARGFDYRMGWYVIIGTIPVGVLGLAFKDQIRSGARNLVVIGVTLIVFALVLAAAEKYGRQRRPIEELTLTDGVVMGLAQALALIPGVSRSGGTISAGLFLGLTREAAARYSFLLAIPAVLASGLFSLPDAIHPADLATANLQASGLQLLVATVLALVVGYASIAWLLRYVVSHTIYVFVYYRIVLGVIVLVLLATTGLTAT